MVADFLRLKNTQEYIELIEERYGNSHIAPHREVLRVVKGGDASEGLKGIPPSGFASTLRLLAEQWEKQEQINEDVRARGTISYPIMSI